MKWLFLLVLKDCVSLISVLFVVIVKLENCEVFNGNCSNNDWKKAEGTTLRHCFTFLLSHKTISFLVSELKFLPLKLKDIFMTMEIAYLQNYYVHSNDKQKYI